ncbi:hypothetical protein [Runella aurantiaca]|nr:hypothetical protein [Runella aurantiaca]
MRSLIFLFFLFMAACQPIAPEQAAVITGRDFTFCGACGGWFVLVDTLTFRAEVPAEFAKPTTPVWIRYEKDESDGLKKAGHWIHIKSIRSR